MASTRRTWIVVSFSFSASMYNALFSPAVTPHGQFVLSELPASISGFACSMLCFCKFALRNLAKNVCDFFCYVHNDRTANVLLVDNCEVTELPGCW